MLVTFDLFLSLFFFFNSIAPPHGTGLPATAVSTSGLATAVPKHGRTEGGINVRLRNESAALALQNFAVLLS